LGAVAALGLGASAYFGIGYLKYERLVSADQIAATHVERANADLQEQLAKLRDRLAATERTLNSAQGRIANLNDETQKQQASAEQTATSKTDRITQLQRICTALTPEVAAEKVAIEQTANQIAIRIGNVLLFNSGVATVLDQFKPIGDRIAATLDKEDGYIKVIGHTDNTPIGSGNVRFPSNHQLSVERAKSVAALFKPALAKSDRLQTDGNGETAPIADNATAEGRAKNRRVEIVIPRTDPGPVSERTCRK